MNQKWKRNIWSTAKILILIYIAAGIILYCTQELLLFHPTTLPQDHEFSFTQPFEELNIPVAERNLSMIKFKTDSSPKGIVLFFHGNMENVEHYAQYPSFFTKLGYELWMIDYPGFGKSTGKRTEQIMYKDAVLMYHLAAKQYHPDRIIIYGKSIGTGVAAYLSSVTQNRKLLLETPYYSVDALARHYFPIYPVIPMTKYAFPVFEYLKKVKTDIIIFHGTADEVIPYQQAKRLEEENPRIELITIKGGKHNNLAGYKQFQDKLDSILSD